MTADEKYMARCIQLARNGFYGAAPNPMVGAVIVRRGRIIGEGYHVCCGGPHAEVNAVRSVEHPEWLTDSTLYVSLEPCSHYGRTPPCADMIVERGIPRVVVGCMDPFARVAGRGIAKLRDAGVEVKVGVLEEECRALNRRFITFHTLRRPFITLKWAQSADGFIDTLRADYACEKAYVFSTPFSQMCMHRVRAAHQAILVGRQTALADNPALSAEARKKTYFDFDEKIQASVTAKVGDKMSFNMNYNTDATFDFDSKNLKLQYEGKEDEIIKNIEAGNVSMTTGSSLIRGSTALFGIKTTMQFGKLTATALISQQQSESKTVNASGGAQTTPFEIRADAYDENRHFFLAHFFRDNYDKFASKLPYVSSGVSINRIEVWITNKQGSYEEARNIVGFMDLAENSRIGNSHWISTTAQPNPMNNSNSLYSEIKNGYPDARNINLVTQALEPLSAYGIEGGQDYVKIESARKLSSSEYTLNAQLGYISLKSKLNADEMLAVAYEYTYNGQVYQVGEFSGDVTDTDQCLYLKMLKSSTISTSLPIWDLMMKNVYSLGAYQVQKGKFRLYIKYMSDSTGVAVNNIPEGNIANKTLLQVMNLDRLDANETEYSDGIFDYIEGYTVQSSNGRIIFPVIEPFGSHLAEQIGNAAIAEKYVYQELYDSTLTVAQQVSEKNKFIMTGEYKASSGAEISLNAMNVPRGSVVVTAGGMTLVENSDYIVDYAMGVVTILNQSIIESGTPISVSLENQSMFNMQRKTMLGLDLNYAFSKDFNIGATIMHLSEKPLTEKVSMGDEVLNNTLWGVNLSYNTSFQWLTNWMNKIPTVNATAPSTLALTAEFAQLVPHQSKTGSTQGSSYIDDFESTQTGLDLKSPYSWTLASTPYDASSDALFPEARYSNDVRYGQNRALLSWYYIDRMFTQKTSSLIPAQLKNDLDQLSNPYVREVSVREIFPNKEINYGESTTQQTLNLSY